MMFSFSKVFRLLLGFGYIGVVAWASPPVRSNDVLLDGITVTRRWDRHAVPDAKISTLELDLLLITHFHHDGPRAIRLVDLEDISDESGQKLTSEDAKQNLAHLKIWRKAELLSSSA